MTACSEPKQQPARVHLEDVKHRLLSDGEINLACAYMPSNPGIRQASKDKCLPTNINPVLSNIDQASYLHTVA